MAGIISDGTSPILRSSDQLNLTAMATLGRSNSSQGLLNSFVVPLNGSKLFSGGRETIELEK